MSRFSIISDEISQDLDEVRGFVREFGLGGFELRSMFGRAFKDLTVEDVRRVRDAAKADGLKIHGCATPVYKCELGDAAATREHEAIFRQSLGVAHELGVPLLRVFTFLRRSEPLTDAVVDRIADHLAPLAEEAQRAGVRLGIENEASCIIGSGGEMLRLGRSLDHPAVGWIWDPCNVLYVPEAGGSAVQGFTELAGRIVHIHVKDARKAPGAALPEPVPVGDGQVGWAGHLKAIHASGYAGLLSLETHWRVNALDHGLLHLPAGHAFSAGGLEASRICMRRLQELWNGVSL